MRLDEAIDGWGRHRVDELSGDELERLRTIITKVRSSRHGSAEIMAMGDDELGEVTALFGPDRQAEVGALLVDIRRWVKAELAAAPAIDNQDDAPTEAAMTSSARLASVLNEARPASNPAEAVSERAVPIQTWAIGLVVVAIVIVLIVAVATG